MQRTKQGIISSAALESIAAAGFSETELMAEGDEWQEPGSHDAGPCREALERFKHFPAHNTYTHVGCELGKFN